MKEDRTSLLSEIREVEEECYQRLEEAKLEAERIIAHAEEEVVRILSNAEKEAEDAAEKRYTAEMESMKQEIQLIHARGQDEARRAREEGMKRASLAVDEIIQTVMQE
jgi:vacuolar-type H+-ATPase subunit H